MRTLRNRHRDMLVEMQNLLFAVALELTDKESVNVFNRVLFPAPLGPKIAVTLPSGRSTFIS